MVATFMESGVSPWPVVETTKTTYSSCGNKLYKQTKQLVIATKIKTLI